MTAMGAAAKRLLAGRRGDTARRLFGDGDGDGRREVWRRVESLRDAARRVEVEQSRADRLLRGDHPQLVSAPGAKRRQICGREDKPTRPAVEGAARGTRRDW